MDSIPNNEIPILPHHVIKIVWQYALQDQRYLSEQKKHLLPLNSSGLIDMLDPREILGPRIDIMYHIENADMVIPLISSDLFTPTDGYVIDTQRMFEMHRDEKLYVISIYISAYDYHNTPLGQLPIFTVKGEALTKYTKHMRQQAYVHVAEEIRKIVEILLTLKWKVTAEEFCEQNYSDLALKACENALQFYEKDPSFHSDIADKDLLQRFQDTLVSCYVLQIKIYLGIGRCEDALVACTKGIEIQTPGPFLYLNKGRILCCLKRFEEAVEAFKTSVSQFEEAREKHNTRILYKEDLYSAYVELISAGDARAEQDKQKWIQRRNALLPGTGKRRGQKYFINRDSEMRLIQTAFDVLLDSEQLLSSPIIDFFGVDGIGKTSILRQIGYICDIRGIPYIWLDAAVSWSQFVHSISRQLRKYTITTEHVTANVNGSFYDALMQAIQKLLAKKSPVVILLDSVDITNEQQSDWIETMLRDVIKDANVCVILTSRQKLSFEHDRSIARKITPYQLKPLDQASSELYLKRVRQKISSKMNKKIFEWTRGYPLAMNAMIQAIDVHPFDFEKEEDRRKLVNIITRRVIDQVVLAKVELAKIQQYKESLGLLSFPRRFNLLIIQELFSRFAPSLASDFRSKLAYMALPTDLNRNTDVLYWDLQRAGFTIDQAVRNIFLLQQRIERPTFFYDIHAFLAKKNEELVNVVTGTDRMRCLCEYLYHSVYSVDAHVLPTRIEKTIQKILQTSLEEEIVQFREEFAVDDELREALGSHVSIIDSLVKENRKRKR
jgi:tetratricopeptide (TPR) repeat protein